MRFASLLLSALVAAPALAAPPAGLPLLDDFESSPGPSGWMQDGNVWVLGYDGSQRLALTPPTVDEFGFAVADAPIPSGYDLAIDFDYYAGGGSGGEGLVLFLADAALPVTSGAVGPGLGYAPALGMPGAGGAWLGLAFDESGAFSGTDVGLGLGPGVLPQSVALRGGEADGFPWLTAAQVAALGGVDGGWRKVHVLLSASGTLVVSMSWDGGLTWTPLFASPVGSLLSARPAAFRIGFSATTTGGTGYHLVDDLAVRAAVDASTSVTSPPDGLRAGDPVGYQFVVSHGAPFPADLVVRDPTPAALENVSWSWRRADGTTGSGTGPIDVPISLGVGEEVRFQVEGTLSPSASGLQTDAVSVIPGAGFGPATPDAPPAPVSFTVADAPVLDPAAPWSLTPMAEDVPGPGDLVGDLLAAAPGYGLAVVGADAAHGAWQRSHDGGVSWQPFDPAPDPAAATLLGRTDRVRFVPDENWNGETRLTFRLWDPAVGTAGEVVDTSVNGGCTPFSADVADAVLTVVPVNDAPVLPALQRFVIPENSPTGSLVGTVQASDVDGDALVFSIRGGDGLGIFSIDPVTGELVVAEASFLDFELQPRMTLDVTVSDGQAEDTQRVIVDLENVNEAPTAIATTVSTAEDVPVAVRLTGTDPDRDWLTFEVVTPPSHGTLAGLAPMLTYTPDPDWNGTDGLTFRVSDGFFLSGTVTVPITVQSVNDDPVLAPAAFSIPENVPLGTLVGTVTASDVDRDALAYTFASGSGLAIDADTGRITVAAALDHEATPELDLVVQVSDGTVAVQAPVTVTVEDVNEAPAVSGGPFEIAERAPVGTLLGTLTGTDPDGDALTYSVVGGGPFAADPATGALTVASGGALDFETAPHLEVTVRVSDGALFTDAVVSVTLTDVNEPPVVTSTAVTSAVEDAAYAYTLTAADPDAGSHLVFTIPTRPSWLTFDATTGLLSGTPTNADVGDHPVVLSVSDGLLSVEQRFTIAVANTNDAPTAIALTASQVPEDAAPGTLVGILEASDPDAGDAHGFALVSAGTPFRVSGDRLEVSGALDFETTPTWTLTLRATDAAGAAFEQALAVSVTDANDPPTPMADVATTDEDAPVTVAVLDNDSDQDGDPLALEAVGDPAHGTATLEGSAVRYVPAADWSGEDAFTYTVVDGRGGQATGTVTVAVGPVNDPPLFVAPTPGPDRVVPATEGEPLSLVVAARDPEQDPVTYALSSGPEGAVVDAATGVVHWTPAWTDAGDHDLVFAASDGLAAAEATVRVHVSFVDLDEDGLADTWEREVGLDPSVADSDGDGIADAVELGPDGTLVDTDEDGVADALDDDSDGDGVLDVEEWGAAAPEGPAPDADGDGVGDWRDPDSDDDGLADGEDVCRIVADPEQADQDGDGVGDACDQDLDGDGLAAADEEALGLDPAVADTDGDGIPDGVEVGDPAAPADTDDDGVLDALDDDSDADGLSDLVECGVPGAPVDTDGDGTFDFRDLDSDDDGVADEDDVCPVVADPGQEDLDADGTGDACDGDYDGDGVANAEDVCPGIADPDQVDTDRDGQGDACDLDDDGDGVPDDVDSCPLAPNATQFDVDEDGIGDACDPEVTPPAQSGGCAAAGGAGGGLGLLLVLGLALVPGLGRRRRGATSAPRTRRPERRRAGTGRAARRRAWRR